FIGGAGVARGYLNRPELTDERFITHPFSNDPNARLYKTGDQARYLPDGNLEFLGRNDTQVKLRGFRIELGEIEAVLNRHPFIKQTICVLRKDDKRDKRLVAYMLPNQDYAPRPSSSILRQYLHEYLPTYMLPASFVYIDALPLTPNGKLDYQALPSDALMQTTENVLTMPRTETERIVSANWQQVLRYGPLDIHTSFFELGGYSLLATLSLSMLKDTFGVDISLSRFFTIPTISEIAKYIDGLLAPPLDHTSALLTSFSRPDDLTVSFVQQRLWLLDQFLSEMPFSHTFSGIRLHGQLDQDALQRSLDALLRRHEILHTTFCIRESYPLHHVEPVQPFHLSSFDMRGKTEQAHEIQRLIEQEANMPFSLADGPLLRGILLTLSDTEQFLLFIAHAIIMDEESKKILLTDLSALYEAEIQGTSDQLPKLPIQYIDFAAFQRSDLYAMHLQADLAYWQEAFNVFPTQTLPADVQLISPSCQCHEFALPSSLLQKLSHLAEKEQTTLLLILLTAFHLVLAQHTQNNHICVSVNTSSRQPLTARLIGNFSNLLPIYADLSKVQSLREVVHLLRSQYAQASQHKALPFEYLLQTLQRAPEEQRFPLFQAVFAMNEPTELHEDAGGIAFSLVNLPAVASPYALRLSLTRHETHLQGSLMYRTDLFNEQIIATLQQCYIAILTQIAEHPDQLWTNDVPMRPLSSRRGNDAVLDQLEHYPFTSPRDLIEVQIEGIWEEILQLHVVGVKDGIASLGGSSLHAVLMLQRLNKVLGKTLPLSKFNTNISIETLAQAIQPLDLPWFPLVRIQPGSRPCPFFGVHSLRGGVMWYEELARELPDQPFYAFQAQGLDGKQPPLDTITDMAACYVEAMRRVQTHGPYIVGGFSLGGFIAFEMALQLQKQGEQVLPILFDTISTSEDFESVQPFTEDAFFWHDKASKYLPELKLEDWRKLSPDQHLPYFLQQVQLVDARSPRHIVPLNGTYLLVEKSNVQAHARYQPGLLHGPLVLCRSVSHESSDPFLGWKPYVKGELIVHHIPGNHWTQLRLPNVKTVARYLKEYL
ncbi:MAG TPA: condensation domain-containing protein, partial [Ktedonobacteraceae bacterium]|nr:condensation domain-containing protein [Ktedonobacteraceae bacterium]